MPNDLGLSDFRSDTVTKPTAAMREAMATAEVGDDVFGDDPTVTRLQDEAAALFGKESALFVPSGTMGNLIAMRCHTRPGDEMICEEQAHMFNCEGGGGAAIAGIQTRTVHGPDGCMPIAALQAAIRKDDPHFPRTALIAVENTHNFYGGRPVPLSHLEKIRALCDEHSLKLHMDGARGMNAAVATGTDPKQYGAIFDTIMLCLSKGLGAPVGSVLVGDAATIHRAHRFRKQLGGGLRQVGVLAAPGLIALHEGPKQLEQDHANARALARALAELPELDCDPAACETNILFVKAKGGAAMNAALADGLAERAVLTVPIGELGIRFVTHRHIDASDVDRAVTAMKAALVVLRS